MADPRHRLGLDAEITVARWLERAGWHVVARRVRSSGGGEVDIVATDPHGTLVGVEVRARRSDRTGTAAGSLDRRRIGRLRRTLAAVAGETPHRGLRIDLVTAEPLGSGDRWVLRRLPGIDA